MTKPDLSIIEAKAGDPGLPYTFTLSVMLANPNAPKDTDGDGVPDAPAAAPASAPTDTTTPADVAAPTTPASAPATPPPAPAAPAQGGAAP
jgi:type IV pilus assembly protein PilN